MASSSSSTSSSSSISAAEESVSIYTPELLWHGGGNENGKPDPVYSVDMHPLDVLATAGIDANIPPKGSVRVSRLFVLDVLEPRLCKAAVLIASESSHIFHKRFSPLHLE
jgi:hypothetical protein